MFDLNKLADMSKLASEAKQLQKRQDAFQQEQVALLKKISQQLDELTLIIKENR